MSVSARMPVAFLPHGGGPWPFVDLGFPAHELESMAAYLRSVATLPRERPRALLVISAHWEEQVPTVQASPAPPMLYDYYGFPPESYRVRWPAPGSPDLAARVRELLTTAGIPSASDERRGFDHGTFVPLSLLYPAADVPTVQLSLKAGLDAGEHLALGRALRPLRDEGVFILGSGMTFHDLRTFFDPRAHGISAAFDGWLQQVVTDAPGKRDEALREWTSAPKARRAHPREEHLVPLHVVAGAAGEDRGVLSWSGTNLGHRLSGFHFG
ncbi:MAG: putative cytoplasmic protein [Pseudomonadota bacterium]|jgi:aromatic ring-opening dioxygenase catalytic subunit (LigB family)